MVYKRGLIFNTIIKRGKKLKLLLKCTASRMMKSLKTLRIMEWLLLSICICIN